MVRRKNFLVTLLAAFFFWGTWLFLVFKIEPVSTFAVLYFLFSLFLASFLTLALLLANSRRGFLLAFGLVLFLGLRLLKMANNLNLILLLAILISLEVYLRKR